MSDEKAIAFGSFLGMAEFLRDNPDIHFTGQYLTDKLIDILNTYESTKHESNRSSISGGTKAIFTGVEKLG